VASGRRSKSPATASLGDRQGHVFEGSTGGTAADLEGPGEPALTRADCAIGHIGAVEQDPAALGRSAPVTR